MPRGQGARIRSVSDAEGHKWLRALEADPGAMSDELAARFFRLAAARLSPDGVTIGTFEGLGLPDEDLELIATRALQATRGGGWSVTEPVRLEDPEEWLEVSGPEDARLESLDLEGTFSRPHPACAPCQRCEALERRNENRRLAAEAALAGPNYLPSTPLPGWVTSSGTAGGVLVEVPAWCLDGHPLPPVAPDHCGQIWCPNCEVMATPRPAPGE